MKKAVKALSIILICWCSLMIVLYLGVIVLNDIEWAPPGWLWMLINSASYLLYGGILIVPLLFVLTMVLLTILRIRYGPLSEGLLRLSMGATAECLAIPLILFIDIWFWNCFRKSEQNGPLQRFVQQPIQKFLQYVCGETLKREGQGLLCQLL